jgi:DNA-binding beta-propeller fold protein YncE
MIRRSSYAMLCALAALGAATPAASADGLPVMGVDAGGSGVADPAGAERYVTVPAAGRTVVAAVQRNGGRITRSGLLRGRFTIPAVALDGSSSGLSADGRTLVLIRPRAHFPQARTTLAIIDPRRLRARRILHLRGDFSFDALSPDGRSLYLIEYVSPRDATRYVVRAYDVPSGRLTREPVIDKREPGERMRGFPVTRATSADGRWAYTLYDGGGQHPFVHALDTVARTAACIDLDALAGRRDIYGLDLALDPGQKTLTVVARGQGLAAIDTRTFRVEQVTSRGESTGGELVRAPILLLALGASLVVGGSLLVRRRRRLANS